MPYGDRNSAGSNSRCSTRVSRSGSSSASRASDGSPSAPEWTSRPATQIRAAPLQPPQPGGEVRQGERRPGRRVGHREHRQQPHHRAHLQSLRRAVGVHEDVVVEAVVVVPQPHVPRPEARHGAGDAEEVLEELGRHHVPRRIERRTSRRRSSASSGRSTPSSSWRRTPPAASPGGSADERSNRPMLSMPRKPPSNRFEPSASLRFTHQPKFSSSLPNTRVRKSWSRAAVDAVDLPGRPRVHRRVHVAEGPLVRRQLTVGVHRPLAAQQQQLLLGRGRVDVRQRDAVEGEVPRGEPRVLPLVRHADDVGERQVAPRDVAPARSRPLRRRGRVGRVAVEPLRRPSSGRAACPTAARRRPAAR